MNPFDIIVVIILAYCVIRGLFRGLIKELASIVGVIAGFYTAYAFYTQLSKILSAWITNASYLNILSFLIIFCLVLIIVNLFGMLIKHLMNIAYLGWIDRSGGFLFGAIKGILIVSVLFIILTTFLPKGAPVLKNAVLSPHVSSVSEKLVNLVSEDMKRQFTKKIEEIKKAWKISN
jgi:membrane protein required for colicin V production